MAGRKGPAQATSARPRRRVAMMMGAGQDIDGIRLNPEEQGIGKATEQRPPQPIMAEWEDPGILPQTARIR